MGPPDLAIANGLIPDGLPSLERCRPYVVMSSPDLAPLARLHGLDGARPSSCALDPGTVPPGCETVLTPSERQRPEARDDDSLLWLATVRLEGTRLLVNLRAPVVINPRRVLGRGGRPPPRDVPGSLRGQQVGGLREHGCCGQPRRSAGRAPPRRTSSARRARRLTPIMEARDWRDADESLVASLYAAETLRWRETLSWDTAATWRVVEAGRRAGTVTGAIAYDATGTPAGWCFALLQNDTLQVGGFLARTTGATTALLQALARSAHGRAARRWIWFGYFDAPGLVEAITARGGASSRYVYLRCRLQAPDAVGETPQSVRAWRASDARQVPALLASAYAHDDPSRPFAPSGQVEEWRDYAALLVGSMGCGVFDPGLSLVAETNPDGLDAAAMVTRIRPSTAHLAQLIVRADAQAAGLGSALLALAQARASAHGCTEITLLVHEHNARARRLYGRAGFRESAAFLSATWDVVQPRSRRDALATGGATTHR